MANLEQKLEAVLFYKNGPIEIEKLAIILNIGEKEVLEGLKKLSESLQNRGICLVLTENEASLATAPEMTTLIEQMAKDEMSREIGKAGLETLAIILYNSDGVSRRKIDYIRGVNSTFILRNLLMRDLVERETAPDNQRTFIYKPTLALLSHLGIKNLSEIPDLEKFRQEMNGSPSILEE